MNQYSETEVLLDDNTKKTRRAYVLGFLLISMFMTSIESTIVATAVPNIVAELGNFSIYSWVFSAFLLMQAVTTPIYGKLSDLFGRKPVFLIGIVIFLIGSILCGFAPSMIMLIIFRFIQGIGAGAVMPVAMTIVGDLYTAEERSKIQGYLSSVWGISSVIGPLAGGLIVQYLHWSWIFWINVPLGIFSIFGVYHYLHEHIDKKTQTIDYLGAGLFTISISALMLILIEGTSWGWTSLPTDSLAILFVITIGIFLWWESRAQSPIMPLHLWKIQLIGVSNVAALLSGAAMIGLASFLPTYVQGIMDSTALVAGFTLTVMSIGWPIASSMVAKLFPKIGFRNTVLIGGVILIIGSIFFVTLTPEKGPIWAAIGSFLVGAGMGFTTSTFTISIQSSVGWELRGVATASNMFMRTLGNALGTAVLGGILNSQLKTYLTSHHGKALHLSSVDAANILLDPIKKAQLSPQTLHVLQNGLTIALHSVYWGLFWFSLLSFVVTLFFPKSEK